MTNKILLSVAFFAYIVCNANFAQGQDADTITQHLNEVIITGYLSRQPIVRVPSSVAVLDSKALSTGSQQSLLPVLNMVPGIRMEERSPGSYRLSIRGSLLRSPFGVRNVKVYFNDLPFTDASGNTYLNLIDPSLLQRVEILKGPDGSLFGANSGGVVLLDSYKSDSLSVHGNVSGGSYGLFRQNALVSGAFKKVQLSFGEAIQRSDGYRQQSGMMRLNVFASGAFRYAESSSLKATLILSDLQYETPGGLTKTQFDENPQSARPGNSPISPGAVEQHAGIYNTTLFGGITNELGLIPSFKHVISVFGTLTDYENPFITNYEMRDEKNGGLRTYFQYGNTNANFRINVYTGMEGQWGVQQISNYENLAGTPGSAITEDKVNISQLVYFSRFTLDVAEKFSAEFSASLNQSRYAFNRDGSNEIRTHKLGNEWMPRIALSYQVIAGVAIRILISRGYSPPTIAEVRSSGITINSGLQAESGWNKEIGVRFSRWNGRIEADVSYYRYDLTNAIVRRTAANDAEIFVNAGGTKQKGIEFLINNIIWKEHSTGFIRGLNLLLSLTYNNFVFDEYRVDGEEYSGNSLTGVPEKNIAAALTLKLPQRFHVFIQSIFTSRIPLNDANSVYASEYTLLQTRIDWKMIKCNKVGVGLFFGGDNLLNETYSLGNDINAFGGRYYNAAPLRNFYGGISVALK